MRTGFQIRIAAGFNILNSQLCKAFALKIHLNSTGEDWTAFLHAKVDTDADGNLLSLSVFCMRFPEKEEWKPNRQIHDTD